MEMVEKAIPMEMAKKVIPIEEMDVVVHEVMVAEAVGTAEEGGMLISKKSKLLHNRLIIFGITRQPRQQPPIMAQ